MRSAAIFPHASVSPSQTLELAEHACMCICRMLAKASSDSPKRLWKESLALQAAIGTFANHCNERKPMKPQKPSPQPKPRKPGC